MGKKRKSAKGTNIASGPSKLDNLVTEAAECLREIKQLEANRKLTFDAFYAAALAVADCDEKRINAIEKIIAERTGTDSIRVFIRRLSKEFSEPRYPRPFPDPSKAVRIFGSTDLGDQMGQHGILAGEVQCLAVRVCHQRFGSEVFGTVTDFRTHEAETKKLRARLENLQSKMTDAVTSADFEISTEYPAVTPSERGRGLVKAFFRRAPGINLGQPDWPRLLVEDAERPIPIAEPKSNSIPRHQLAETTSVAA